MIIRNKHFNRHALRIASAMLAAAGALWVASVTAQTPAAANIFTAEEIKKILSHGPWPVSAQ